MWLHATSAAPSRGTLSIPSMFQLNQSLIGGRRIDSAKRYQGSSARLLPARRPDCTRSVVNASCGYEELPTRKRGDPDGAGADPSPTGVDPVRHRDRGEGAPHRGRGPGGAVVAGLAGSSHRQALVLLVGAATIEVAHQPRALRAPGPRGGGRD